MARIFTLGHSTRTADDLVRLLRVHGIGLLADVRRYPGSRRHPRFGRDALAETLRSEGIEYVHLPDLGGRRAPRPDSPNDAWRNAGFRGYADHMDTDAFRSALAALIRYAEALPTAVMCAEALPWRCHRRLVADALLVRGHEVVHVISERAAEAHELHQCARVLRAERLVYPAEPRAAEQMGLFDDESGPAPN